MLNTWKPQRTNLILGWLWSQYVPLIKLVNDLLEVSINPVKKEIRQFANYPILWLCVLAWWWKRPDGYLWYTFFECYHTALYFGENKRVKDKIVTCSSNRQISSWTYIIIAKQTIAWFYSQSHRNLDGYNKQIWWYRSF